MKFKKQNIMGVFLIEHEPYWDHRGRLERHFCAKEYGEAGLNPEIRQTNLSFNNHKYTLRGFHYQKPPHSECKTISCINGKIYDIVVDVRPDSPSFLKWQTFELDHDKNESLYVPSGCANAFLTLCDNTLIIYYMSEFYTSNAYCGIRYDDPIFKFEWPHNPSVISDKDKSYDNFCAQK